MCRFYLITIVVLLIISEISLNSAFVRNHKFHSNLFLSTAYKDSVHAKETSTFDLSPDQSFVRWTNPDISPTELKENWESVDPLMTVGVAGVTTSLMNSLLDLTSHHNIVKVKLASNRLDAHEISKAFMSDTRVADQVILLEVRSRAFAVRRQQLLPPKIKKEREFEYSEKRSTDGKVSAASRTARSTRSPATSKVESDGSRPSLKMDIKKRGLGSSSNGEMSTSARRSRNRKASNFSE